MFDLKLGGRGKTSDVQDTHKTRATYKTRMPNMDMNNGKDRLSVKRATFIVVWTVFRGIMLITHRMSYSKLGLPF